MEHLWWMWTRGRGCPFIGSVGILPPAQSIVQLLGTVGASLLILLSSSFLSFFFFCFLGPKPQCVGVSWLGVESELQLRAYTTATATSDLRRVCNLHHSSQQLWILNPLRKARDQTCILMGPSWICFCYSTMGTPPAVFSPFFSYYINVNITFLFFIFIWRHHGT